MKLSAAALLLAGASALAAVPAPPQPEQETEAGQVAESPEAPAPAAPASDYTTRMLDPPMVGELDPATLPPPAYAEPSDDDGMRQCRGPDGVPIYTDRRCGDLGATPRVLPPMGAPGAAYGQALRVKTCARNQSALLEGVRAALESHDANRLADYYHWTGMGSTEAYRLMDRLDSFSARPVVDVQLVRQAQPEASDPYGYGFDYGEPTPPPLPEEGTDGDPPDPYAAAEPPPRRRRPLASMLRVDQMRSEKDVASEVTYFHLLTNAGCWWMRF